MPEGLHPTVSIEDRFAELEAMTYEEVLTIYSERNDPSKAAESSNKNFCIHSILCTEYATIRTPVSLSE